MKASMYCTAVHTILYYMYYSEAFLLGFFVFVSNLTILSNGGRLAKNFEMSMINTARTLGFQFRSRRFHFRITLNPTSRNRSSNHAVE